MELSGVPFSFYIRRMERFAPTPAAIDHAKAAIQASPAWVRVGLTYGNERIREEALSVLASNVVERLANPPVDVDPRQLPLL